MLKLFRSSTNQLLLTLLASAVVFVPVACGEDQRPQRIPGFGGESGGDGDGQGGRSSSGDGITLPTTLEAENFVRAFDSDTLQEGSESCVREANPATDISAAENASGGCSVGYAIAGEWLEYDVYVAETGSFDFSFALGSDLAGQSVSISIDGVRRGAVDVPEIGWEDFEEVTLQGIGIEKGEHVLRVNFDTGAANFDYVRIDSAGQCVPACDGKSCGGDFCGGTCGSCNDEQSCTSGGQCVGPFERAIDLYGALSVSGNQVLGEDGKAAQLRGVSTQWLNWEAIYAGNAKNMKFMRDAWGLQVYRIANGVEGNNGYADASVREARLAKVKEIIETAVDLGIYVIVDWHTHEAEHLELAKEFFAEIATEYGDLPNIIYEPYNEPLGPSMGSETYWSDELKPYHEEIVAEIRKHDPDNLIILGTPRWSQNVDLAAADPVSGINLAYTLHFYSCSHGQWLRDRGQDALDAGVALFVTEWAATHADGGTPENPGVCLAEAQKWHDWMNSNAISSAAWKLNDDGDESAILSWGASPDGDWSNEDLSEHGNFTREMIQLQ